MKKTIKLWGIIALVAVIGFAATACDNGGGGDDVIVGPLPPAPSGTAVTFMNVTTITIESTTTMLSLYFSQAVPGLSASDITLSGVSGVTKGSLGMVAGSGGSVYVYNLNISGFTSGGTLNVSVAKAGYTFSGSPKQVTIYYSGSGGGGDIPVTFSSVTANGSSSTTTTQLTLTFSQAIPGLSANDIDLSGVSVTKGSLSGSGPTYTLGISGFTSDEILTVTVMKAGYEITISALPVTIYYSAAPTHDINPALFGTWKDKDTNGASLTITFSSGGITWGGTVGDSLNTTTSTLQGSGYNFMWIANGGAISYKYTIGSTPMTVPVYSYSINGSGELEFGIASMPDYVMFTLAK